MAPPKCPHCGIMLTHREMRAAQCPSCGQALRRQVLEVQPVTAADDGWGGYTESQETHRRARTLGWGTARAGLPAFAIGTLLFLGSIAAMLTFDAMREGRDERYDQAMKQWREKNRNKPVLEEPAPEPEREEPSAFEVGIQNPVMLSFFASTGIILAGVWMACAAPTGIGRGFAVAAVICLAVFVSLFVIGRMADHQNHQARTKFHRELRLDDPAAKRPPLPRLDDHAAKRPEFVPTWKEDTLKWIWFTALGFAVLGGAFYCLSQWGAARALRSPGLAADWFTFFLVGSLLSAGTVGLHWYRLSEREDIETRSKKLEEEDLRKAGEARAPAPLLGVREQLETDRRQQRENYRQIGWIMLALMGAGALWITLLLLRTRARITRALLT